MRWTYNKKGRFVAATGCRNPVPGVERTASGDVLSSPQKTFVFSNTVRRRPMSSDVRVSILVQCNKNSKLARRYWNISSCTRRWQIKSLSLSLSLSLCVCLSVCLSVCFSHCIVIVACGTGILRILQQDKRHRHWRIVRYMGPWRLVHVTSAA